MAKRNVVDFKIINLSEEKFQELKEAGQIDPNAIYVTPDVSLKTNQITNCITEIPQDVKLELTSDGKIIAKTGSKFYKPNGAEYTPTTIDHDISIGVGEASSTGKYFLFVGGDFGYDYFKASRCCSGTTDIYAGSSFHVWYDTTSNQIKIYRENGTTVAYTQSFPCAIITATNSKITSIDQVFNGFGYIGSTIFALPGVKYLEPNGRNADGTLKNIEKTLSAVRYMNMESWMAGRTNAPLTLDAVYGVTGMDIDPADWGIVKKLSDIVRPSYYACYYCLEDNLVHYFNGSGVESISQRAFVGSFDVDSNNKIASFTPKTAFHAVDYNDFENTKQELNAEIATVDSNAVHKTGAETIDGDKTFTGNIIKTNTVLAKRNVDNSYMEWFGGTQYNKGAYFRANGKDLAEDPGTFTCSANDGVTFRNLVGYVNGGLYWDNQRVLTSGSAYGGPDYSAAVQIWSGWTATSNGVVFGGASYGDNLNAKITVNGQIVFWVSTSHGGTSYGNAVVSKGDVVTVEGGTYYFAPMK